MCSREDDPTQHDPYDHADCDHRRGVCMVNESRLMKPDEHRPGHGPDGPFVDVSSRDYSRDKLYGVASSADYRNARLRSPLTVLLVELDQLVARKNSGYAGDSPEDPWSNYRSAERLGFTALDNALLRLNEKHNRVTTLYRRAGHDLVGEGLRETLLDSAAVALIAVALLDERPNPRPPIGSEGWCKDPTCPHWPTVHTVGMHPTMDRNLADTGRPGVGGA